MRNYKDSRAQSILNNIIITQILAGLVKILSFEKDLL